MSRQFYLSQEWLPLFVVVDLWANESDKPYHPHTERGAMIEILKSMVDLGELSSERDVLRGSHANLDTLINLTEPSGRCRPVRLQPPRRRGESKASPTSANHCRSQGALCKDGR